MNYYILSDWPVFWSTTFSSNIVKWTFEYNSIRNTWAFKIKKCLSHNKLSFTNRSFPFYLIMAVESVNYDCAVRGYHVYKSVWEPKERQVLSCLHEENNISDMFAIKTYLTDEWKRANCWASATGIVSVHKIFVRSWSSCYHKINQHPLSKISPGSRRSWNFLSG